MDLPGADRARRVGPYTLLGRRSAFGGSEAFTARSGDGLLVTVTVVGPGLAADPGFRDRFRAAVEVARTLSGAFLVPVVDADADASAPWLATGFTAGLPLRQAVDRHGPLSEPALRALADGLARALAVLHAVGAVHGEVNPDSVLLTMEGPRITAMGIAGATGSPAPSAADDMSALGETVLFAASGRVPDTDALPVSLREVIGGCLYPEPGERPTAEQLVDYLRRQSLPVLRGSWLPPAVTADMAAATAALGAVSAASRDRGPLTPEPVAASGAGVSRRNLIIGLAGGVAVLGGAAAAVAFSDDSSPAPDGRAARPGPTSGSASSRAVRPTSASSAPPSPTGGPEAIVLTAPDAVKEWSGTGKHAPTCLEASDKVVMVVTGNGTSFLDAATGKSTFASMNTTNEFGVGSFVYPTAYADGVFYLLCDTPDQTGLLAAFGAADGKAKWATQLADGERSGADTALYWSTYVAAVGDTVYLCGQLNLLDGKSSTDEPTTGFVRAYDAATGKRLWQVKGTDINNVLVPATGSRLLATSAVPTGRAGRVQMIDAGRKGARGWKVSVQASQYYFSTGWPLTCYAAGLFLFAAGTGDTLSAVDAATGREKWHQPFKSKNGDKVTIGAPFASLDGATVYVAVGSDLAALDTADGTVRWVATLDGASDTGSSNMFNAALRVTGKSAQCSADTVFATDSAKTLWAIDAATGRARWKYTDPGQPDVGFLWTVGGDHVFIASHLTLTAIAAHGG
ncbi:PQQ-binding-like beta-propeller repeat protein [Streptomyces sp. NBC_00102]|uniref:outer membrane protein assembly factor BamB family protein n=1 Tax=Streptomyces sp. NBC_00102 TaxID=2975652 RepID=UPI002253DD25|nr:PQQ-binding-like beta-propeller repeat protein [Streptomyces sp. NBC_00102]MCX5400634.1 PQQ-binding-like beta-propeller repeat protein [Streptomyces sp. NBC_00102]